MHELAEGLQFWRLPDLGLVPSSSSTRQDSGTNGAEDNDNDRVVDQKLPRYLRPQRGCR